MADRFPLIVNSVSKKIEELVSGDNLDLTGNGIVVSGNTGAGKYLSSNGTTVFWGDPGDVYLTQTQTITNKTFETCVISGSTNNLTNIANASLVNSGITVNGTTISLGGSVTTPNNNTTYTVSAQDGGSASEKLIRLTSGGNFGAGVNDDITFGVGSPSSVPSGSNAVSLFIDRSGDVLTLSGHVVDNNTITTITAPGGSPQSGAISFTSSGAATVSMTGSTVNIDALDNDTRTKIRAGSAGTYGPLDTQQGLFTFLDGTGTTVAQSVDGNGDPTITYTSTDTVTQVRGGSTGTYTPTTSGTSTTQISIEGGTALGGNTVVSQSGNTILIDSTDTNTVTKLGSDNNGSPVAPAAGDFVFKQSGATTIRQSTNASGQIEIEIESLNTDTGAGLNALSTGGLLLTGSSFSLKNYNNLTGTTVMKWDSGNNQLSDSIITDDGTTVTIGGDLVVSGTQTIINTSVLQVEDNIIELRKGTSITGADGGIQINRTTDGNGVVTSYQQLQWDESNGYWRSYDGSVENRFVTENETQVLTNKTLTNPTLTTPSLGAATATSINGLEFASTASASLDIQSGKTVDINNDLTFTSDNATGNVSVNFRVGGDVAYKSDTLASFSSTTATQLRSLISGTTGTDDLVFQTSPVILTSLVTTSTGFALLNSGAQSIQFGGAATAIDVGSQSGTVTFNGNVVIGKDLTLGTDENELFQCNARVDFANSDVLIRGGSSEPMTVGRGTSAVATNTALGKQALFSVSSGSQNTATGYEALLTANSGAGNTAYGYQALRATGTGDNNTAVGRSSMLGNLSGEKNTTLGANTLESSTVGDANVCIGYYSGFAATGTGNVLIGPADSSNPVNDATYRPPSASGDRQLVIGSGTEYWIRGNSNFDVTLNNDVTVNNSLTVKGDFVVNGVQTVVQSNILEVADKNIELAKVVSTQFTCATSDGSANITAISPTLGLIPGMVVTSNTAGVSVPNGTTILSITNNTATLSNNVTGSGTPTFSAIGPSDTAADGGGIILKGAPSDHTWTWSNANDAWQSSEDIDLAAGKTYNIIDGAGNARQMMSLTQIGPTAGTGVVSGLGTGVTSSSLTSVGTLTALSLSGNITLTSGSIFGTSGAAGVLTLRSASGNTNHSRIEVGTSEGSDNGGIHFYTAGSTVATRAITIKGTSQNVGIGEDAPSDRLVVQEAKPSDDVAIRIKNDTTTDGDATNPTTASLYFNTSTADFNTFYIQARRNDNDTHFGYADPRDANHVPTMVLTNEKQVLIGTTIPNSFNGVGQAHNLIVAGSTSDTDITDNSSAAITISNTDGTADNTAGLHFAREDTDANPHYTGASIVAQFKETMNTGQYPKADLAFLVSPANNNAPQEKMRIYASGAVTKSTNPLIRTSGSTNFGAVGSLTTNTANVGISQGGAALNYGDNGWSTTGSNAYTFVCPVNGVYVVHAHVSYGNIGGGRKIWVMSYTLGGGNLPLDSYVEVMDHTSVDYANFSYYDTYYFTAGTRVGMGRNGGSGTITGQTFKWGIHLLQ